MIHAPAQEHEGALSPAPIQASHALPIRLQIGGFFVIVALLGLDAYVGIHGAASIREGLAQAERDQTTAIHLIEQTLQAQHALKNIQERIAQENDATGRQQSLLEVQKIDRSLHGLFAQAAPREGDRALWSRTEAAAQTLTADMQRALSGPAAADLARLDRDYGDLAAATADLVDANHGSGESVRRQIESSSRRQSIEDRLLLSGCLVVAGLFLWTAGRTHRLLREQSEELTRVSWQLLEKQESLARRLSRELHDELGQSLTALKTNFARHSSAACVDSSWMADCTGLLTDSIRSAHEISQLLRPTVLDDFGLDSALAWLCERFEDRNGIRVSYTADFHDRLEPQTETHVFRIAQEALTNVARHASASAVSVAFSRLNNLVSLEITDDGAGLLAAARAGGNSFGLTGMKARARSMQGAMEVHSAPGAGTTIRVTFPFRAIHDEEDKNTSR